eukprot:3667048-Rhodomonas_salina.3
MGRHDASDVRPDGLVVNKDLKFAEKNQFGDKYRNYEDSARQVASVAFTAPSPLLTYQCHATRVSFRKTTASPTRSSLWTSQSSSHIPAFPFAMHAREACAGLTWRMVGPESSSCVRNGCTNHLPCIRRAMSNPDTGLLLPGSTILERMANSRAWRSALPTRAQYGSASHLLPCPGLTQRSEPAVPCTVLTPRIMLPDVDIPNSLHAYMTAEAIREAYPVSLSQRLQVRSWSSALSVFLRPRGLILRLLRPGREMGLVLADGSVARPRKSHVRSTTSLRACYAMPGIELANASKLYPVLIELRSQTGCRFSEKNVFPEFFSENPDAKHVVYGTENGMYAPNCGVSCAMGLGEGYAESGTDVAATAKSSANGARCTGKGAEWL